MNRSDMRAALRLHLKGAGTTWSDAELNRSITHAVHDLSRFVPYEKYYEKRLDFDEVSSESVTLVAGTKALANKPVKWDSETVLDTDSNACTRGTDYEMDYINGTITRIAGGEIASATETITVSYTRSKIAIDLSSLTELIRIQRVEYPVGNVPQKFVTYDQWGDILTITGHPFEPQADAQKELSNDKHVGVHYEAYHTDPTDTVTGSYPLFFDEIVIKGAEAYAWLIEAAQYEHQAVTDFASARTELASISHTELDTALDAINTAADAATTTLGLIASPTDHHAAIKTAVDAANTELDSIVNAVAGEGLYDATQVEDMAAGSEGATFLSDATANAISMEAYLTQGDATIETVNVGESVAPEYRQYAEVAGAIHDRLRAIAALHVQRAGVHTQAALGFVQEALGRIRQIENYIAEANTEIAGANAYAREGEARVTQMQAYLGEADRYIQIGTMNLELAAKYREMGITRRNEFWAIIGDRSQRGMDTHTVSTNQSMGSKTGGAR